MPRPMLRTRSWRRVSVRTPSGRVVVHYEKRRPGVAKCSVCGKPLNGVPSLRPSKMSKLAKTEKRPERMYGGVVCPDCLARGLREAVRAQL
ncbi:50S ribosomal protein L34e [Thermosphaera chiliense]|uniref:Large ribosomal subunit protein eL34 n=1 Tax=Thermosphaera chiliense TaxID=3402707 RepID=A0A7M1UR62_9CREN|nr:50S ribosomal protein L34e [Thermosphaera aggregans]QOR94750.1 50S ribosomal protein L34e [Thermosphaera aggregans]